MFIVSDIKKIKQEEKKMIVLPHMVLEKIMIERWITRGQTCSSRRRPTNKKRPDQIASSFMGIIPGKAFWAQSYLINERHWQTNF